MFGYKRIVVGQNQRAVMLRDKMLDAILEPGVYKIFDLAGRVGVTIYDLSQPRFSNALSGAFLRDHEALVHQHFTVVNAGANRVALVYEDDQLIDLLPPGKRAFYWRGGPEIRIEAVSVADDAAIEPAIAQQLIRPRQPSLVAAARQFVYPVEIADGQVGMLLIDGKMQRVLEPGAYAFWRLERSVKVEVLETRLSAMEVSGQEILTRDKVSLRINLVAQYAISDPVVARSAARDFADTLYRELQFALRQAVGARTLDVLLANKGEMDTVIFDQITGRAAALGIDIASVGVKDIILPGDMKDILNQVVEAQKVAEANVIKRREETSATRSLLNTARIMDENPTLLRLKELESLERVAEKVDRLTVFGGLDAVMNDTVRMQLGE